MENLILKHNKQINFILDNGYDYLNEWEHEFIDSIQIRLSKGIDTTFSQQKKLNEIFTRIQDKLG